MIRWAALWLLSLGFTLLTMVIAPALPLFATSAGLLPWWLSWCGTPDNDMDGDRSDWTMLPVGSYWRRVLWLWRNPAYGFEISVTGATIEPGVSVWIKPGSSVAIKNRDLAIAGSYYVEVGNYWNWKWICPIGAGRCVMLEFGWKLQPYAQHGAPLSIERAQLVFSPRITAFKPATT